MPVVPLRVGGGEGWWPRSACLPVWTGGEDGGRGSRGAPNGRAEEEGGRLNRGLDTRPNVQIGQQRMARAHVSLLFSCSACPVLD